MSCCLIRKVEVGVEGLGGNRVLISMLFSFIITTPTSLLLCVAAHTPYIYIYVHTWHVLPLPDRLAHFPKTQTAIISATS